MLLMFSVADFAFIHIGGIYFLLALSSTECRHRLHKMTQEHVLKLAHIARHPDPSKFESTAGEIFMFLVYIIT